MGWVKTYRGLLYSLCELLGGLLYRLCKFSWGVALQIVQTFMGR